MLERVAEGVAVAPAEIVALTRAWLDGGADDAQMAALLATGWDPEVAGAGLVDALLASGDRLELARLGSTGAFVGAGAVGDTAEIAVAPVAAALGVTVALVAAPAAWPVLGTEDKLGCIPGMRRGLDATALAKGARDAGIVVGATRDRLAAGIRRIARLAEGTGTSRTPWLGAALVCARALAGGAQALVIEMPSGPGAALHDAAAMEAAVGEAMAGRGRSVELCSADASAPLGPAIGTALEIRAVGELLTGGGDPHLRARVTALAGRLAELAGVAGEGEGLAGAERVVASGEALATAERWIEAQGGPPEIWTDDMLVAHAPLQAEVTAPRTGTVTGVDPVALAEVARWLGAGRMHPRQALDFAAGVELLVRPGDDVGEGEPVAVLHGRAADMVDAARDSAAEAFTVDGAG